MSTTAGNDEAGVLRTNLAPLYQSGQRPTRVEDVKYRPVDPTTGKPLEPRVQPGYYPGYSTLAHKAFWDEATRNVILNRVENPPPIRFFTPEEAELMQAVADRIVPQDDRVPARRIPILPAIDRRLHDGIIDGYRYENMPPDHEAFRLGLKGIDAVAQHLHGRSFVQLDPLQQEHVLDTLHDGDPPAGHDCWDQMPVLHFWQLLVQDCVEAYYAHPYAWDEIGYGGPAYPQGYMRLNRGEPEPWEVEERRYAWAPPPGAISGQFKSIGRDAGAKTPIPGQEGTH